MSNVHPTIQAIVEKLKTGDYEYEDSYGGSIATVSLGVGRVYVVEYVRGISHVVLYWKEHDRGLIKIPLTGTEYSLLEVHAREDIRDGSPRKYLDASHEFFNHKGYGG
jgi:hypothetical protein